MGFSRTFRTVPVTTQDWYKFLKDLEPDPGTIAHASLADSAALSVLGRAVNAAGTPADISAGVDGHVLRRSGVTLGFGTILSTSVSDFTEATQDAVGAALTDTASVDLTYSDAGNTISATVLPAGVNHNSLLNYVANEHINHTAVTLTAGNGLTGGGDISANRTFNVGAGTGISVAADAVSVDLAATFAWTDAHSWTTQLLLPDTGFMFSADTNTGVQRIAADEWGLYSGGTNRMTIANGGVVAKVNFFAPDGSAANPSISFDNFFTAGLSAAAGLVRMSVAGAEVARFDSNTTAGNTRFLIYDVDNGTVERVSVGAADSGGAGFKVLRIPN